MITNGFTSGFFPAPAASGVALSHGRNGAPADGALGMFEALLGLVASAPQAGAGTGEAATDGSGGEPLAATDLAALFGTDPAVAPAETAVTPPVDAEPLLADLIDALGALNDAMASGAPVDPALEADVMKKLEVLAEALGIALPVAPPAEIATSILTPPDGTIDVLDPLGAIREVRRPGTGTPAPADDGATPAGALPAVATGPATGAPATPLDPLAPPTPFTVAAGVTAGEPLVAAPPPVVAQLAEKLGEMATALEPRVPGLARQLQALADKLGSGEIDAETLARLGIPAMGEALPDADLDAAIRRLLTAMPEVKAPATPQPFTTPGLAVPELLGGAPKDKAAPGAPTPYVAAPAAERSETKVEFEVRPAPEARTADRGPKIETEAPQQQQRPAVNAPAQAAAAPTAPDSQPGQQAAIATTATVATAGVTADARAMHAAYAAPVRQINIPQVAFEIVRQVQSGASRFQIRLDPPELGRIDVKLDVDAAGNVNARMTVERAETLDLMQRDQRALERALAQAGLDGTKTNLEFSLRQNPFAHQEQQQRQGDGSFAALAGLDDVAPPAPLAVNQILAYRGTASPGGVNLFV